MSSAESAVLLDGGGLEIYADGVDHCEIVGPVVKLVLFEHRHPFATERPMQVESVAVFMPLRDHP